MSDAIDAPYPTITASIDLTSGTQDGTEVVDGELQAVGARPNSAEGSAR